MPIHIHDLPPELLTQIFDHGLCPYIDFDSSAFDRRQEILSSICLVSRFWRDVAYGTSSLWSLFRLHHNEALPEPDYGPRRAQLERAKNTMLDIIIHHKTPRMPGSGCPALWEFWQELKRKNTQWRSLRIDRVPMKSVTDFERTFPLSLPNLSELKTILSPSVDLTPGVIDAPRLRRYEYRDDFPHFTPTHNLEFLRVTSRTPPVVERCPGLRTLQIDRPQLFSFAWTQSVTSHSLRHLVLSAIRGSENVLYVLKNLTAPNLHVVSITNFGSKQPSHDPVQRRHTPIILPGLTTIEFGFDALLQINCIRAIIGQLDNRTSITLRLLSPMEMVSRHGLRANEFAEVDGALEWLQDNAKELVWINEEDPTEDCLASWRELRGQLLSVRRNLTEVPKTRRLIFVSIGFFFHIVK